MSVQKCIIIEDDTLLGQQFKTILEMQDFKVKLFLSAEDYFHGKVEETPPTLYLVDINLPGMQGLELVKLIRYKDKISPIFVISGGILADEISHAYKAGADDYLVKPYNPDHLILKIANVQKKFELLYKSMMDVGVKLIPEANLVIKDGEKMKLTTQEYKIIEHLISDPKNIHSREDLAKNMGENEITDRTVDVHVSSLRKKIRKINLGIETCRGVGYRIILNVED